MWISEFQLWWTGAWIVACDRKWRESFRWGMEREFQIMNGERERVEINKKKNEENDYLNKIDGKIDKLI